VGRSGAHRQWSAGLAKSPVPAQQFAAFAKSYYPEENTLLAVDVTKVRLSSFGLLALVRAKEHVIAEPSKLSHLIQALDNKSAYGSFQPAI